ncbi:MAG: hypothetical protein M0C28_00945 [Candidatus Moduliflexus flocculans]|nr:hypothetical protein [Candidatus Moduliflexus flocculans]
MPKRSCRSFLRKAARSEVFVLRTFETLLDVVDPLDLVHGGLGQRFDLGLELEDLLKAFPGLVEQAGPLFFEFADHDAVVGE